MPTPCANAQYSGQLLTQRRQQVLQLWIYQLMMMMMMLLLLVIMIFKLLKLWNLMPVKLQEVGILVSILVPFFIN